MGLNAQSGAFARLGSQQQRRMPVALRSRPLNAINQLSNGVDTQGNYKVRHVAQVGCASPRLRYTNSFNNIGTDNNGPNALTITAAIEYPAGTFHPVYFNGSRTLVLPPGASFESDDVGLDFAAGDQFWSRTFVTVAAGEKWPLGVTLLYADEGVSRGTAVGDLTLGGATPSVTEFAFSPTITAVPGSGRVAAVGIIGDSIAAGTGDSVSVDQGLFYRALQPAGIPFQVVAYPGELANGFKSTTRHRNRMLMLQGCLFGICAYGVNDFNNGFTYAQVLANLQLMWASLGRFGMAVYQTTITPRTTSTDAWATTGNQTKAYTATIEGYRTQLNDFIRTTPAGLAGFIDLADAMETARNSGIWKAGYTGDGTHPNTTGHAAAALVVPTAAFV